MSPAVQLCCPVADLALTDKMVCVIKRRDSSGVWLQPGGTDLNVSLAIPISTLHTREIKLSYSEELIGKQDKMGTV